MGGKSGIAHDHGNKFKVRGAGIADGVRFTPSCQDGITGTDPCRGDPVIQHPAAFQDDIDLILLIMLVGADARARREGKSGAQAASGVELLALEEMLKGDGPDPAAHIPTNFSFHL
jgi:hypothetical protein